LADSITLLIFRLLSGLCRYLRYREDRVFSGFSSVPSGATCVGVGRASPARADGELAHVARRATTD